MGIKTLLRQPATLLLVQSELAGIGTRCSLPQKSSFHSLIVQEDSGILPAGISHCKQLISTDPIQGTFEALSCPLSFNSVCSQ